MALTKTVTKFFPTDAFKGAINVGIHLKVEDDGLTVIDQDFTEVYTKGANIENELKNTIRNRAQEAINSYKYRKNVNNSPEYGETVSEIDGGLAL